MVKLIPHLEPKVQKQLLKVAIPHARQPVRDAMLLNVRHLLNFDIANMFDRVDCTGDAVTFLKKLTGIHGNNSLLLKLLTILSDANFRDLFLQTASGEPGDIAFSEVNSLFSQLKELQKRR